VWGLIGSTLRVLESKEMLSSAKGSANNRSWLPTQVRQRH
jgi:hypothetical protein